MAIGTTMTLTLIVTVMVIRITTTVSTGQMSTILGVLRKWKQAFGSAATYQCLARALKHPVVGRSSLAVKYCGVHACEDTGEGGEDSYSKKRTSSELPLFNH